jgi:hypothetical protein
VGGAIVVNASTLIAQCKEFQAILVPEGEHLRVQAPEPLPPDILEELRQHKSEVIAHLTNKKYPLKYPDCPASEQELQEIEVRVLVEGYVLLWSNTLNDFVAFYKTEADRGKIPPGFVPYSYDELWGLFDKNSSPDKHTLTLIHEAKKLGAQVIED